jgi:hypothetical protein
MKVHFFSHTVFAILCMFAISGLFAQPGGYNDFYDNWPFIEGDSAIAEKYLLWAEDAVTAGRWSEAKAALERAVDYANVSSDLSYLLAIVRSHENENRYSVLQALDRAIGTGRWFRYSESQARLFQAEQLIVLRHYSAALDSLAVVRAANGETIDLALLRLTALKGLINERAEPRISFARLLPILLEFRRNMLETLNRYPRDPRPLRIFFDYSLIYFPQGDDIAIMVELVLNRLDRKSVV